MRQLTKNFHSLEFGKDLPDYAENNYFLLCLFLLEKVRERFGVVKITSGFRTQNDQFRLIANGYQPSPTSQHMSGEAADFVCHNTNMLEVYRFVVDELKWPGEVILYPVKGHLHIALPRLGIRADHFIKDEAVIA